MSELNPFKDHDPFQWINDLRAHMKEESYKQAYIDDAEWERAKATKEKKKRERRAYNARPYLSRYPKHYRARCPDCDGVQVWCSYHQEHEPVEKFGLRANTTNPRSYCLEGERAAVSMQRVGVSIHDTIGFSEKVDARVRHHVSKYCDECNETQRWCPYHKMHEPIENFATGRTQRPAFCRKAESERSNARQKAARKKVLQETL